MNKSEYLEDAEKMAQALRDRAEKYAKTSPPQESAELMLSAATKIEELNNFQNSQCTSLLAENARLRAERDKAVEDIEKMMGQDVGDDKCWACDPGFDCEKERRCVPQWRGTEGKA